MGTAAWLQALIILPGPLTYAARRCSTPAGAV